MEETARKDVLEKLRAHVYRLNDAGLIQFRDDASAILAALLAALQAESTGGSNLNY